jgi:hypothetical protein
VQDAAGVGVVDRVADVHEPPQQFAQGERGCVSAPSFWRPTPGADATGLAAVTFLNRLLERVALDEPNREPKVLVC